MQRGIVSLSEQMEYRMNRKWKNLLRWMLPIGSLMLGVSLSAAPRLQDPQQPAPDNTKQNKNQSNPSADQQKMNAADRELTRKIRKVIHDDSNLSTYAHNIKIIAQNGKVTLRGPVRSEEEKANIEAKALEVAGAGKGNKDN